MEKNNNEPKLRFPGFTEPWEQRKFSDITYLAGEKNRDNIPYQSYSISNEKGFIPQDEQFENGGTMKEADKSMYLIVQPNSFAYNPARINIGSIGYYDLPENVIVSSLYEVFKTSDDIEDRFLWHWFKSDLFSKFIERYQEGGVRMYFYYNKLCMCSLNLPSIEEQRKIGEYFDKLDNLIILHQRKLNHLQDKKKSLLQKMFPKNGEDFPELRFPGFTAPWEQRKLKQLANFAKGQGYSKNDLTDGGTPIILYGRLYTKYQSAISEVDTFAIPQSGSIYSTGEEVIVPASGETAEDIARASAIVKSGFLLGGDLNIIYPNKDISTIFLALSISNGKQQKELSKKAQGKSVVHLHNSDLEDVTISFPCREEQERIGSIFTHLDNLITLHQRKLNHLQEQKKALLQQMFI